MFGKHARRGIEQLRTARCDIGSGGIHGGGDCALNRTKMSD
jgi:hypothetical protein